MRMPRNSLEIMCLAALIVGVAAGSLLTALSATHRRATDDAWRRTASGWERIDRRPTAQTKAAAKSEPSQRLLPADDNNRWDTHPAALALAQLIGALVILRFIPRGASFNPGVWRRTTAAIAHSYRASFFGA